MNYEELLEAKARSGQNKIRLPIGDYYKKRSEDEKYHNVVDIRAELNHSIVFAEGLKRECEQNVQLVGNRQIHFTAEKNESGDICSLNLEPGSYQTFEQLLNDNPAVVAQKGFVDDVVKQLLDYTTYLHGQGIWHVCFSPRNVFARKGDNGVMLLSHGSFYLNMKDPKQLYEGYEEYVAPEVLNCGTIDQRCDIYSIGKFVEHLFASAQMPLEYRRVLKKATSESPEDRYETPDDMLKALQRRRSTYHSILTFVIALVVALLCVGLYFEIFPETQPIEFVKPAPKDAEDDLLDDGFDPTTELGTSDEPVQTNPDSISTELTPEQQQQMKEYQAKAEQIFRKQYEREADRILSKIYTKEHMNASEKKFMAESRSTMEELSKKQQELAGAAGLNEETSQRIASEIIEKLSNQKKAKLDFNNTQIKK